MPLAIAGCLLTGCSKSSKEETQCRANISKGLLNPETAEFHDFRTTNVAALRSAVEEAFWEERSVAKSDRGNYGTQVTEIVDDLIKNLTSKTDAYYSMRVRAEGRIGNKVTSNYVCVVNAGKCACIA